MNDYIILPDVTCDLGENVRNYFGIRDHVHGRVYISDGRDIETTLEWNSISRDEFYGALSDKRLKVTSSPASPEEYYRVFRSYAERGIDVLNLSLSSKISSTVSVATDAAKRVMAEFPERRVYILDSFRMSGAMGLLTMYAQDLQNAGKSMDEVIDWLENNKRRVHQMGPIDDLMFIARRGRISTGKAIFGSFAGVKPMGDCNSDGYVTVITKAKGIKKALSLTVAYMKEAAVDIKEQYVLVVHSDREAYANTLAEQIERELCPKKVFISDVFASSGTNIGPGMVGAYFLGDVVSEENVKEKEMMNRAIEACR